MTKIEDIMIRDFQKIEVAHVAPSNHLIVFAGKNAQGKSSGLNAIEAALTGHSSRNNPRPIREGAKRGATRLELDNGLTVERKYSASGSTLTVKSVDGGKYGQAALTELVGTLGLDVSQFTNLGEKQQRETLLEVVELPFSPAELDKQRAALFDARKDANRKAKELRAVVEQLPEIAAGTPGAEVSFSELADQFQQGETLNRQILAAAENVERWRETVARLEQELAAANQQLTNAHQHLESAPPRVDTEAIKQRIERAEEINSEVRAKRAAEAKRAALAEAEREAQELNAKLEAVDAQKREGLENAIFPVPHLSFDDEGLLYKGVPFSRASDAEKILVSAAMMISLDPELRSLIVRNGNNLDASHLNELRAMAEQHDFQIFIEIVAEHGEFEYTFIDGILAD